MGGAWTAGVIRAKTLVSRSLGAPAASSLASNATLDDALRALCATPYRRYVHRESALAEAQHEVSATLLWHMRVLAGWLPRTGGLLLRPLAAGFEIANVETRLRHLRGAPDGRGARAGAAPELPGPAMSQEPYRLGSLDTAWRRLEHAGSPAEVRALLAASPWGDPGDDTAWAVAAYLRTAAAARVARTVRPARRWAEGRTALLVARTRYVDDRPLPEPARRQVALLLGPSAAGAARYVDFRNSLPRSARWALDGVDDVRDLWRAEARWWSVVESDGTAMLRAVRYGPVPVVGAVALLSVDAWRTRAALEAAARGGAGRGAFDAMD
ncbi:hypothetical protein [Streptomyces sp. NPDC059176]|uniref:hypothetical protein n=1 Tax=unclassified Streptomyces TaxID=2593676 RepID=UPI0036B93D6C